jgi:hypothetical protein
VAMAMRGTSWLEALPKNKTSPRAAAPHMQWTGDGDLA